MAKPMLQRKRSAVDLEEKAVIKRQISERTLVANRLESCLYLGNASPGVMEDQVPCLSPKFERAQQANGESVITFFEKDSESKTSKPDIERECRPESENDDYSLSEDVENKQVPLIEAVVDDVPIKTKTPEYELEAEGEDEPDGFLGRITDKVGDIVAQHHHHHHDELDYDLEGFSIYLPARFHQFDIPCPFGARLRRSDEGYTLAKILSDTVAYKATLRESDVVTHLNDNDLKTMGICEIQRLFMHVDTVFTLTILRKCGDGDDVHFMKTTFKVTIADKIEVGVMREEVGVMHEEVTNCDKPVSTSLLSYIAQKVGENTTIYLNATENEVTMGNENGRKAEFYLDFYPVCGKLNGQRCVIRNATTDEFYDAVQNNMKKAKNQACMLDKRKLRDDQFVFESVEKKGYYLTYDTGLKTLTLCEDSSIPTSTSRYFQVNCV